MGEGHVHEVFPSSAIPKPAKAQFYIGHFAIYQTDDETMNFDAVHVTLNVSLKNMQMQT
jgi:hypothetical protein